MLPHYLATRIELGVPLQYRSQSSGADLLFYSDQGALLYKYERVCQWQSNIQSSEYANRCSILTPVAMSYPELFLSLKMLTWPKSRPNLASSSFFNQRRDEQYDACEQAGNSVSSCDYCSA